MKSKSPTNIPSTSNKPQRTARICVKKQNGESSKSKKEKFKDDVSLLMKSLSTSVTSLHEIIKLFKNATPEIIDLITNECSIILECKICKNLFRSLANFMTHKRGFCLGKFEQLFQNHEHADHVWYSKCRKNKVLSSRSTTRKDILALIESMKGSVEQEGSEVTILKDLEPTNEGLFNLRYNAQDPARANERVVTVDPEETQDETGEGELTSMDSSKCTFCQKEFPTLKALNIHVKKEHGGLKMCFVCPCCKKLFSNAWSVYRHMYKVHRKTSEQVRKLRNQIQKKQVTQEDLERSKKGYMQSRVERKDQEKAFLEDLKGHGSLQHCSECGKKFDRKVALIAHAAQCNKKLTAPPDLLRSLKRKALTPVKVGDEKKAKYSHDEMLMRHMKVLDARVILTKTDVSSMLNLKKEIIDDDSNETSFPKLDDETKIKSFIEAYKGNDDSEANSELPATCEDLLNKLSLEVNVCEEISISDSDPEEKRVAIENGDENPQDMKVTRPVLISEDSESLDSESQDGDDGYLEEDDSDNEDNNEETDVIQKSDGDRDSDSAEFEEEVLILNEDDDSDENQDCDNAPLDPLKVGSENDQADHLEEDNNNGQSIQEISDQEDVLRNAQEVDLVEVGGDNIMAQEFTPEACLVFYEDNDSQNQNSTHIRNCDDSVNDNHSKEGQLATQESEENEIANLSSSDDVLSNITEVDDLEAEGFRGFNDIEHNLAKVSLMHESINNNKNKLMLREFEKISDHEERCNLSKNVDDVPGNNVQGNSSFCNLSEVDSNKYLDEYDPLRYDMDDSNYIVAKEIVLFNDSEGVCISNMSNSEILEDSFKSSLPSLESENIETSESYFSKLNGGSPTLPSPHHSYDMEDIGDTVADDGDWLTKKINSLMNGQKKKCLLCLKTFHKAVFVRRHVASHYNINKFKCLVNSCNFQSFLRVDMNSHLIKVHKKKELESFVGRLYPGKEDFDDSLYNPDPKPHPLNESSKTVRTRSSIVNTSISFSNAIMLDGSSMDGIDVCAEMELPCTEETPKILTCNGPEAHNSSDEDELPHLQNSQSQHPMMDAMFGNKLSDCSQDSSVATT